MNQFPSGVLEKISGLLSSLSLTYKELSLVAEEIDDLNLKVALESLSSESCQFAEELSIQLKVMGIKVQQAETLEHIPDTVDEDYLNPAPGAEVAYICKKHETSIIQAYTRVLNERLPFPVISQMLRLQFGAIRDGFIKLSLLNNSRFAFL